MSDYLRSNWSKSKVYRVFLIITVLFVLLRLLVQGVYLAMMLAPGQDADSGLPEWAGSEGPMVPVDLQVYLDAAKHFKLKEDLYLQDSLESIEYHFPYPPSYAMLFVPFLWTSPLVASILHTIFNIVAYVFLYLVWWGIFQTLGLKQANQMLIWTFPVWLVFSAFWSDLSYLNIYIILALMSTFLIKAILNERLGWSVFWLALILQTKPMWAFAAGVPLLLGRWRFFLKLMLFTLGVYMGIVGVTILVAGYPYGGQQYRAYVQLLSRLGQDFPWRGPEAPFLGYNHSIKQIIVYLWGLSPKTLNIATFIKIILLLPLVKVCLEHICYPLHQPGYKVPERGLNLAFALYLGAFIWLDIVWELSLGIAIFTYLLATSKRLFVKAIIWAIFLPYALVDFFQVVGFATLGMDAILPGPYVITDPSMYVPLTMLVILVFYILLIHRLLVNKRVCRSV